MKEKILTPEMKSQIIDVLIADESLTKMTFLIQNYLYLTWGLEDTEVLDSVTKQMLVSPLNKFLLEQINAPLTHVKFTSKDVELILTAFVKNFSNTEKNKIFIEKILTQSMIKRKSAMQEIIKKFALHGELLSMTLRTNVELLTLKPPLSNAYLSKVLYDTVQKRIDFYKDYFTDIPENSVMFNPRFYMRNNKNWYQNRTYMMLILMISLLAMLLQYFFPEKLIIAGLLFLILIAPKALNIFVRATLISFTQSYESFLMDYHLSQEILKTLQEIKEQKISNTSLIEVEKTQAKKLPKKTLTSYPEEFLEEPSFRSTNTSSFFFERKKIKEKKNQLRLQKEAVLEKKEKIEVITWKVKTTNAVKDIIYHSLRDIFKIIELWTLNPKKANFNQLYYVYWVAEEIKQIFDKYKKDASKTLYPAFYEAGHTGHMHNDEQKQGYIYCGSYAEQGELFKIKTKRAEGIKRYRLFCKTISETKVVDEQGKNHNKILLQPSRLELTHG